MLDIILTILGVIGIILLVLLGMVLAILLIVLFFPITYKAEGLKDRDSFVVKAKANWLFRVIRVRFSYPEPGNVVVKALWFTLYDSKAEKVDKKEKNKKSADQTVHNSQEAVPMSQETTPASQGAPISQAAPISPDSSDEQKAVKTPGILQNLIDKFEKIKFKILNVYDKIKYIWKNIKFYKDLLQEEQTKELLRHLGFRLKKILLSIRPRRLKADIVFGASSPDTTGYCMAVYGILSPCLGKSVRFAPDFEQAVFRGEFSLAGHITVFPLLWHAAIFALDRKLKLLITKVKNFHANNDTGGQTAA